MRGKIAIALDLVEGCKEFAALIPEVRTNLVTLGSVLEAEVMF